MNDTPARPLYQCRCTDIDIRKIHFYVAGREPSGPVMTIECQSLSRGQRVIIELSKAGEAAVRVEDCD